METSIMVLHLLLPLMNILQVKIHIPFEDASGKQYFCLMPQSHELFVLGWKGRDTMFFLTSSHHWDKEVVKRGENHHQLPQNSWQESQMNPTPEEAPAGFLVGLHLHKYWACPPPYPEPPCKMEFWPLAFQLLFCISTPAIKQSYLGLRVRGFRQP